MKSACLFLALALPAFSADPLPDPQAVLVAMKKATAFYHDKLAVHGGYASGWKADFSAGMTEHKESPTVISIQPPGTTTMGLALVKAFRATGDMQFLRAARAAAGALIECQLASGGWDSDFDFEPEQAKKMVAQWEAFAQRTRAIPWPWAGKYGTGKAQAPRTSDQGYLTTISPPTGGGSLRARGQYG